MKSACYKANLAIKKQLANKQIRVSEMNRDL